MKRVLTTPCLPLSGALWGVSLALIAGCATLGGGGKGPSGAATPEQVQARNKALESLRDTALQPCAEKLKPTDSGVMVVSARPDGTLVMGPMQWQGSDEMKQCIQTEGMKAHLPPWSGPTVTWLWPVGSKENPPPKSITPPASYDDKQGDYLRRAQGDATTGGPVSVCVQKALPPDAWARVTLRLFVFPDGKVVGVTPWTSEGEGKDGLYQECLQDIPKSWTFDSFAGPGYTVVDTTMNTGIKPPM